VVHLRQRAVAVGMIATLVVWPIVLLYLGFFLEQYGDGFYWWANGLALAAIWIPVQIVSLPPPRPGEDPGNPHDPPTPPGIGDRIKLAVLYLVIGGICTALFAGFSTGVVRGALQSRLNSTFSGEIDRQLLLTRPAAQRGTFTPGDRVLPIDLSKSAIDAEIFYALPAHLRANHLEQLKVTLFLQWETDLVGKYSNGARALRYKCQAKLVDQSARVIAEETIFGSPPPQTISRHWFNWSAEYGTKPVRSVVHWLREQAKDV
jgi:hypothetical protein